MSRCRADGWNQGCNCDNAPFRTGDTCETLDFCLNGDCGEHGTCEQLPTDARSCESCIDSLIAQLLLRC